ncbi:PTS sugar transporter subunit IIC [bacterium]|nr:PTS sugar transporter subunit IIC [bacterium]
MVYKILWISVIGGILNLDFRAMGQFMFYRPFVAGAIIGLTLGDIQTGVFVGIMVELIWISNISMGVAIPWNIGAIGVMSVGLVFLSGEFSGEAVVLSIALAIPFGWLFKKVDIWWRHKNKFCNRWIEQWIEKDKLYRIFLLNWAVILAIFLSSFLFYFVSFLFAIRILVGSLKIMSFPFKKGLRLAYELLPFLGFAMAWNAFALKSVMPGRKK